MVIRLTSPVGSMYHVIVSREGIRQGVVLMRIMNGTLLSLVVLVAASVSAQEGAESEDAAEVAGEAEDIVLDPNAPPSAEAGCFSIRRVRNFSGLDNEYLYVEQTGGSHYLLTMFRSCLGLRNAQAIAIESHQDRVCSNSQADVTFRGVGGRRESCGIRTVEEVEDRDAARTLVEMRTAGD